MGSRDARIPSCHSFLIARLRGSRVHRPAGRARAGPGRVGQARSIRCGWSAGLRACAWATGGVAEGITGCLAHGDQRCPPSFAFETSAENDRSWCVLLAVDRARVRAARVQPHSKSGLVSEIGAPSSALSLKGSSLLLGVQTVTTISHLVRVPHLLHRLTCLEVRFNKMPGCPDVPVSRAFNNRASFHRKLLLAV